MPAAKKVGGVPALGGRTCEASVRLCGVSTRRTQQAVGENGGRGQRPCAERPGAARFPSKRCGRLEGKREPRSLPHFLGVFRPSTSRAFLSSALRLLVLFLHRVPGPRDLLRVQGRTAACPVGLRRAVQESGVLCFTLEHYKVV